MFSSDLREFFEGTFVPGFDENPLGFSRELNGVLPLYTAERLMEFVGEIELVLAEQSADLDLSLDALDRNNYTDTGLAYLPLKLAFRQYSLRDFLSWVKISILDFLNNK